MPLHLARRFSASVLLARTVYSQVTSLPPAVWPSAFASTSLLPACPVNYFQCPETQGYGCCPIGYTCGTADECFLPQPLSTLASTASSSSPAECAGRKGYFSCAQSLGGDCCPNGYICDTATDVACRLTLRLNQVTETLTATTRGFMEIWTTTGIVGPALTAVDRVPEAVARETTTTNSGSHAQQTDTASNDGGGTSSNDSGLTSQQIGGIVGGVLGAALLLLAGSAFLVLRHRRRQQRRAADGPENPYEKKEMDGQGWGRAELPSQTAAAEVLGSYPEYELPGGYEVHGTSELDDTPRS